MHSANFMEYSVSRPKIIAADSVWPSSQGEWAKPEEVSCAERAMPQPSPPRPGRGPEQSCLCGNAGRRRPRDHRHAARARIPDLRQLLRARKPRPGLRPDRCPRSRLQAPRHVLATGPGRSSDLFLQCTTASRGGACRPGSAHARQDPGHREVHLGFRHGDPLPDRRGTGHSLARCAAPTGDPLRAPGRRTAPLGIRPRRRGSGLPSAPPWRRLPGRGAAPGRR